MNTSSSSPRITRVPYNYNLESAPRGDTLIILTKGGVPTLAQISSVDLAKQSGFVGWAYPPIRVPEEEEGRSLRSPSRCPRQDKDAQRKVSARNLLCLRMRQEKRIMLWCTISMVLAFVGAYFAHQFAPGQLWIVSAAVGLAFDFYLFRHRAKYKDLRNEWEEHLTPGPY